MKYFTVAWPDSGTRFWVIVVSVDTWKLLNQRELVFLTESFYESFKISKFQYSIKFFTATWPNTGTNNRKFSENISTQKKEKKEKRKAMRQDNFRKCSWCHYFSEIFHYVINRQKNTNSWIFRIENIGQIYHRHKICEILNCDLTKTLEQEI